MLLLKKKYKNPHKLDLAIIVNKDGFKPEEEEKKEQSLQL